MYTIRNFEIRTEISEFTVAEFETIGSILKGDESEVLERYFNLLEYLKLPEEILYDLTDAELFAAIAAFNIQKHQTDLVPSFELGGYTYRAYPDGEEFVLRAKDLALIEKAGQEDSKLLSRLLSIIFKREDLGNKEHYEPAHMKHKAKLFGELNAAEMYPYLIYITKRINQQMDGHLKSIAANTESVTQ